MAQEQQSPQKNYTRADLQQMYALYLRTEGYVPTVDKDGDVAFRFEGGSYYIEVDETDLEYFRIVFPGFWPIESDEERQRVMIALDHANSTTKNTKVFKARENVTATAEVFLPAPENFAKVFRRCMAAMTYGVNEFHTKMRELPVASTALAGGR